MPDVFISYSRKDRPIAEAIAAQLSAAGAEVWWDRDLLGGEDYRKKTAGVISQVAVAIVVWSRRSIDSSWVVGEASAARERKVLVPVTADGVMPPLDFRSLNTIDMASWAPGDPLPDMLLRAISDRIGRPLSITSSPQKSEGLDRFARNVARSWFADFECLLFSFIAQGFASALTNIPLAIHEDKLSTIAVAGIATLNAVVTAAVIMRPALSTKRLAIAAAWFAAAIGVGIAGYYVTGALYSTLEINEYLTFVGFWALGLLLVLDAARRAAPNA
ncbi:MAG: toll/interleukin-1 receptor domain-containing protein [Parvularculaceae bacterium]